jgi:hypothetical protein
MKLIKELGNKFQRDEKQQNIQKEKMNVKRKGINCSHVNLLDKNRINKIKKTGWKTSPQIFFFSCKKLKKDENNSGWMEFFTSANYMYFSVSKRFR